MLIITTKYLSNSNIKPHKFLEKRSRIYLKHKILNEIKKLRPPYVHVTVLAIVQQSTTILAVF